jgi:hypothetical protein
MKWALLKDHGKQLHSQKTLHVWYKTLLEESSGVLNNSGPNQKHLLCTFHTNQFCILCNFLCIIFCLIHCHIDAIQHGSVVGQYQHLWGRVWYMVQYDKTIESASYTFMKSSSYQLSKQRKQIILLRASQRLQTGFSPVIGFIADISWHLLHVALLFSHLIVHSPTMWHCSDGNQASHFQNWKFSFNIILQAIVSEWYLYCLRRNECPIWALKIKYPSS